MSEVTPEMIDAYVEAWEAKRQEIGDGDAAPGTKTRAGLEAVFLMLRTAVREAVAEQLRDDIYVCTRDASAWGYGTMSLEDFEAAVDNDDVVDRITDAALEAMGASVSAEPDLRYELFPGTREALDALTIRTAPPREGETT